MAEIARNTCNGRYGSQYTQILSIIVNSQSIANNTSNVTITYTNQNTVTNTANYGYDNPATLSITDAIQTQTYSQANPSTDYRNKAIVTLATWTGDVTHNSDGTLTISVAASFSSNSSSLSGGSVSGTYTLSTIPRYANFTEYYVSSTSVNSISVHWNADAYCDLGQYSLNDGTWIDIAGLDYTISGLSPNTQYNVRTRIRRGDSQLWTTSGYIYGTTKDYAKVTGAIDFNSNANPYMEFTNPSGLTCNLRLEFGGTYISRNGYSGTGGGYTFELTQAERDLLYSKCPNSNTLTVRYVVATILNGTETWWSYVDKTMYVVNSNPIFSSFSYEDTGTVSTQLTGNNQIIINSFNYVHVKIPVANKAVAQNGATIVKYRAVCGNVSDEKSYSSDSEVVLGLGYITSRSISVYATDSRGNSTKVTITISTSNWRNYTNPVISSATATRQNGVGTETTLTFSGTFWKPSLSNDFGAVPNAIEECYYCYKKTNESNYGSAINITPTISSGNISFNSLIAGDEGANGFSLTSNYNIQVVIKDKLRYATFNFILGAGSPAMAIHKNGVAFGAPYNPTVGGAVQINELIPACSDTVMAFAVNQLYITISQPWTGYKIQLDGADITGTALTFHGTNNRIVVNKAGYIDFFAQLDVYSNGYVNGDYALQIRKNGNGYSDIAYEQINANKMYDKLTGQQFGVYANVGDYFEMFISCGETGTVRTFSGAMVSLIARYRRP